MKNLLPFLTLIIFVGFFSLYSKSQSPIIQWQQSYGGSNHEEACSIKLTSDSGYIVCGYTFSKDGDVLGNHDTTETTSDSWILKLNSFGNIQWQKCYGGSLNERAYSIQQTFDGGYITAGKTNSNNGDVSGNHSNDYDYWVLKLDSAGIIQWQKCLGGSGDDEATSIIQTNIGNYVVVGYTYYSNDGDVTGYHGGYGDYWIVCLDSFGQIKWQKCFGGSGCEKAFSIQQTSDEGFVIAGYADLNNGDVSGNHGSSGDYWIVKLDSVGNFQWQKCLGGSDNEEAYSIEQTNDGGYIVGGYASSNDGDVSGCHGGYDYWIVKLNSTGNIQWQKCLGGSIYEYAYSIQQTIDNGYIVAGGCSSFDGDVVGKHWGIDFWIVKLDTVGNLQWQKCLGGSSFDEAYSIRQTMDGQYIVAGRTDSNDEDITINHGGVDIWVVKLDPNTMIQKENIFTKIEIYPNPVIDVLHIKSPQKSLIEISNINGQIIKKHCNNDKITTIDLENISKGFYIIKVKSDKEIVTNKFIKE
jgi:hypothetical protein